MLNRLPRQMPPMSWMLDDIGNPKPRDLARALGVSERTVKGWIARDEAPTPALLALFWLTRWGQQAVDAEAHNAACMHATMVALLRGELAELNVRLQRLGRIADFGSANDPAEAIHQHAQPAPRGPGAPAGIPVRTGNDPINPLEEPVKPASFRG
jgi:hypothetical protein